MLSTQVNLGCLKSAATAMVHVWIWFAFPTCHLVDMMTLQRVHCYIHLKISSNPSEDAACMITYQKKKKKNTNLPPCTVCRRAIFRMRSLHARNYNFLSTFKYGPDTSGAKCKQKVSENLMK